MNKQRMMRGAGLMAAVAGGLFFAGCVTTTKDVDPTQRNTMSTNFSVDDFQQTVDTMVDSMLEFPPVKELTAQRRPMLVVNKVANNTSQYIDLEAMTNSIRTRLIRSGKFRFQDRTNDAALANELGYQKQSGMVNPTTQGQFRKQVGAEFMLYGSISEMSQHAGRTTDVAYMVTMNLRDIQTGEIVWTDEQKCRKVQTKPVFGM